MKNNTIVQIGVISVFTILFGILLIPITDNLFQSFCGGIILGLFYKALTDFHSKKQ